MNIAPPPPIIDLPAPLNVDEFNSNYVKNTTAKSNDEVITQLYNRLHFKNSSIKRRLPPPQ